MAEAKEDEIAVDNGIIIMAVIGSVLWVILLAALIFFIITFVVYRKKHGGKNRYMYIICIALFNYI